MKTLHRKRNLAARLASSTPYMELENGTRVFHSDDVYNEGEPAARGWYWELSKQPGNWQGPFANIQACTLYALRKEGRK